MNFEFDLLNERAVKKALKDVDPKLAKKAFRKAMRQAMKIIQNEIKRLAPVDTGALKKAVKVRAAPRSRQYIGVDVVIDKSANAFASDHYYAMFLEFGAQNKDGSVKIHPQPFIRPAFDGKAKQAKSYALKQMPKLIEEQIKKAATKK